MLGPVIAASILAGGCQRQASDGPQAARSNRTYTENELNKLITPGMSAAEVTNKFGPPASEIEVTKGTFLLTYSFPFDPNNHALHLVGFSIHVKNGNVIRWSPDMGESSPPAIIQAAGSQSSLGEQSFQVFLATDNLSNVAKTVDAVGSADATDLNSTPAATFKAEVSVGSTGNERPGEQTVTLTLNDQDVAVLKRLSEDNFGKRLLVVCRNKVIAAPAISTPLISRQLTFTANGAALNTLRSP